MFQRLSRSERNPEQQKQSIQHECQIILGRYCRKRVVLQAGENRCEHHAQSTDDYPHRFAGKQVSTEAVIDVLLLYQMIIPRPTPQIGNRALAGTFKLRTILRLFKTGK